MNARDSRRATELFDGYRRTGDVAAITELFDLVTPSLLGLAQHLVREPADAEDLVQECFLAAIRKPRRWDARRPVFPWLAGILIREAKKTRRRSARRVGRADDRRLTEPPADRVALEGELRVAVEQALDGLPAKYRDVLELYLIVGEEPRDIAARLSRAPGTVRVQIHRGLDLLRHALPPGFALGLAAIGGQRGLSALREVVRLEALARGSAIAGSVHKGLTTGALIVNQKVAGLTALSAAAVLGTATLVPFGDAPLPLATASPSSTSIASEGRALDLVAPASAKRTGRAAAADLRQKPERDDRTTAASETVPTPILLTGELFGASEPPEDGFLLAVSLTEGTERLVTHSLGRAGPFHVDISDILSDRDPSTARVLVVATGEGVHPVQCLGHLRRRRRERSAGVCRELRADEGRARPARAIGSGRRGTSIRGLGRLHAR